MDSEKPGLIFDIKEFAVFDGPGIRTTVFLKGCPLRCMWCHNPEGLSFKPELMASRNGCINCGKCREVCPNKDAGEPGDGCVLCQECIKVCPQNLRKICGERMTPGELTDKLMRNSEYLKMQGGGVTFSGGEPAGQPEFLLECLKRLRPMHRSIETSGYCQPEIFKSLLNELDYIIMDIKIADGAKHKIYTGVGNRLILKNLEQVKASNKPFRIRIPVIPGVNDTQENYRRTAALLKGADNLEMVELLPYHKTAGAKYGMVGRVYKPVFNADREPNLETSAFEEAGICCRRM